MIIANCIPTSHSGCGPQHNMIIKSQPSAAFSMLLLSIAKDKIMD